MGIRVNDVIAAMEDMAPAILAEPWDNIGLLAGHPEQIIDGILLALDITMAVVEEAKQRHCQMIVAHHPIFFKGIKTLREDQPEGILAATILRSQMAVFAAHTNLDRADGGLNDYLLNRLELVFTAADNYVKMGSWNGGECEALLAHVQHSLSAPYARLFGDPNAKVQHIAVVSGSGMDYWPDALALGAQVLITGDVRHHDALDALASGLQIIDAGHLPTERLCVDLLGEGLQKRLNSVEYSLRIEKSGVNVYTPFWTE